MPSDSRKPPSKIAGGKYEIDKRLGAGCFGEVWRGHDTTTKQQVAVKFEDYQGHSLQLEHEVEILRIMGKPVQPQGFVQCFYWGHEGRHHCMVMELLGRSLEDMVQYCKGRLNVASTLLAADQILRRLEYLHHKGFIHRDIKPENFMFGVKDKAHHLYLIDFGLSKRYYEGNRHSQMRTKLSLTGTARYASINAHKGIEQSRRDDLEAIGHMMLYFLRGVLPWSGLDARTQEEKYKKIREKKEETPLDELCTNFPDCFKNYLRIVRNLDFKERPDYNGYRKMFDDVRQKLYPSLQEHEFQWNEGKDLGGKLTPIGPWEPLRQPDEETGRASTASRNSGGSQPSAAVGAASPSPCFCFCGGKSATKD